MARRLRRVTHAGVVRPLASLAHRAWSLAMSQADTIPSQRDSDPLETAEWLESLRSVLEKQGSRAGQLPARRAERGGASQRRRAAVHRHHALHQHDPGRQAAALSRQSRARAAHQEHHPLERDGDGHAGQQGARRHRRPHLHVRLGRHAVRSGLQPLLPRQGRRLLRRPDLLPRSRLARHVRPGLSRRPARRAEPRELPPRAGRRAAGCRPIRIPG